MDNEKIKTFNLRVPEELVSAFELVRARHRGNIKWASAAAAVMLLLDQPVAAQNEIIHLMQDWRNRQEFEHRLQAAGRWELFGIPIRLDGPAQAIVRDLAAENKETPQQWVENAIQAAIESETGGKRLAAKKSTK